MRHRLHICFAISVSLLCLEWNAAFATSVSETSLREIEAKATYSKTMPGHVTVPCTNTLIDSQLINNAITSSDAGDSIIIVGTCLINSTIKLKGNRAYAGTSQTGTILRQANSANLPALLTSDAYLDNSDATGLPVAIRHLTIDGNCKMNGKAKTDGLIVRSWLSTIEDVRVTDMCNDGIRIVSTDSEGKRGKSTQVNGRIASNFINRSGRHGIYSESKVTDWNLLDNWVAFSGGDAIHLEEAAGWTIERNHVYGVEQNAIYAAKIYGTSISDNYVEGFGESDQGGQWCGICASIQGAAGSTIANNRIFNIGRNRHGFASHNSKYTYIRLTSNYDSGLVAINGNVLRGIDTDMEVGISYSSSGHSLTVSSSGNAVLNIKIPRHMGAGVQLTDW